ncbi:hypothetical protein BGY98DRAFT_934479 [Russula aff. rugulosa BPL654]|nr:hypothetical protein BGY98DRAFT_934479 [Russula aff. rugulosa BPL654]
MSHEITIALVPRCSARAGRWGDNASIMTRIMLTPSFDQGGNPTPALAPVTASVDRCIGQTVLYLYRTRVSDSEVLIVWNGQQRLAKGLSKRGVIASGSSVNYESPGSDEQAGTRHTHIARRPEWNDGASTITPQKGAAALGTPVVPRPELHS